MAELKLKVLDVNNQLVDIQEIKSQNPDYDFKLLTSLALGRIDNYQGYTPPKQTEINIETLTLRDKISGEIVNFDASNRDELWFFCVERNYSLYNLISFILNFRGNFHSWEIMENAEFNLDNYLKELNDEIVEDLSENEELLLDTILEEIRSENI